MKKQIILSLIAVSCTLSAFAQRASYNSSSFFSTSRAEKSISVGIRGGFNVANSAEEAATTSMVGYNVGVSLDVPILESLYFQSGVYASEKGYNLNSIEARVHYLEFPILASYRYNINDNWQIQLNFGPYFAAGLAAKRTNGSHETDLFDREIMKRFDAGLQIGTGVTYKRVYLGLGYDIGLCNVTMVGTDAKTRAFFMHAGFNF